mgnify:CR=1 FL=1
MVCILELHSYMEVVGRAKQDARAEGANSRVIPWMVCILKLHSYMEVVGRAKQDARAEGASIRIFFRCNILIFKGGLILQNMMQEQFPLP